MADSRAVLRSWWHDPVHYRWLVRTLESHFALGPVKFIIGSGGAVMLLINILMSLSPAGPSGTVERAIFAFAGITAAIWMVRWWLFPWPRALASLALCTWADIAITASCLVDCDRVYGALSAMLLVVTGAYITFFHSPQALAVHAAWSLLSIGVIAACVVTDSKGGDLPLAAAMVLIMVAAIVMVLPALQFCYWVLRTDVLSDPLTTLLNRRGLDYYLYRSRHQRLSVITLDLDRFKAVNDTFGHIVGDQVLTSTAEGLRAVVDPDAIVARTGGEEFAVVGELDRDGALATAEKLRRAVEVSSGLPVAITASVGVAVCEGGADTDRPQLLLRRADAAMYEAKQLGGNAVVLARPPIHRPEAAPIRRRELSRRGK